MAVWKGTDSTTGTLNVIGCGCLLAVPNRFCLPQMSKRTPGNLFRISAAAGEDFGLV